LDRTDGFRENGSIQADIDSRAVKPERQLPPRPTLPYRSFHAHDSARVLRVVVRIGIAANCVVSFGAAIWANLAIARFQREAGWLSLYSAPAPRLDYYLLWGESRPLSVVLWWTALMFSMTAVFMFVYYRRVREWWWVIAVHIVIAILAVSGIVDAASPLYP
jgi:hypothetical protein